MAGHGAALLWGADTPPREEDRELAQSIVLGNQLVLFGSVRRSVCPAQCNMLNVYLPLSVLSELSQLSKKLTLWKRRSLKHFNTKILRPLMGKTTFSKFIQNNLFY